MKTTLRIISMILMLFSVTGCGVKDLKSDEVMHYLERHYEREFTFISSEKVPRSERKNLDPRMETDESSNETGDDDIVDVYEDEKGIQFHVWHYLRYGVVGSWVVMDDYAVQWLMSQPELYKKLEESEYECTYFNFIGNGITGYEAKDGAGFTLTISNYSDIRPAVELAFDIVSNDAAILPDHGIYNTKDDIQGLDCYRRPMIPKIILKTSEGQIIESIKFRTEQIQWMTDKENLIRSAECNYISFVKNGNIKETLAKETRSEKLEDTIPLYIDNTNICSMKRNYGDKYWICDSVPVGKKMEFENLKKICEYCGYTFKPQGNKLYITKDDNTIMISRRSQYSNNKSVFAVYRNNIPYIPEGDIDDVLENDECRLTIADYKYLFDITISVDYDNNTSVVLK